MQLSDQEFLNYINKYVPSNKAKYRFVDQVPKPKLIELSRALVSLLAEYAVEEQEANELVGITNRIALEHQKTILKSPWRSLIQRWYLKYCIERKDNDDDHQPAADSV